MENGNILSGSVEVLKSLKESIIELNNCKTRCKELELEEKRIDKLIKTKEKTINDEVISTVKTREEEIEKAFDLEIDKINTRIKKIQNKKERLKTAKVSERIDIETSELQENIKNIKLECKNIIRQRNMPKVSRTNLYLSLFSPKGIKEYVLLFICIIASLLILPSCIYFFLIPVKKTIYLIMIYFITVVVFGGCYIIINNKMRDKYKEELKKIRNLKNGHKDNVKEIKRIKKTIVKDKDESGYGLEKFDQQLSHMQDEVTNTLDKKKEAILTYENSTKLIISSEIRNKYQEEINILIEGYDEISQEIKISEEKIREISMDIATNYEAYIGKELIQLDKLENLIIFMEEKNVEMVSEAIVAFNATN